MHTGQRRAGRRPCVRVWRWAGSLWQNAGRRLGEEGVGVTMSLAPSSPAVVQKKQDSTPQIRWSGGPTSYPAAMYSMWSSSSPGLDLALATKRWMLQRTPIHTNEVSTQHRVRNVQVQQHTRGNVENHCYLGKWSLILLEFVLRIGYHLGSEIEATSMKNLRVKVRSNL